MTKYESTWKVEVWNPCLKGFGFFATVTGVFGHGAMLEGFFATGNARGFIATVQKVFLRRLGRFFATVNE